MNGLTLVIDGWNDTELKKYLLTLNGILKFDIKNDNNIGIYIKYNPNITSAKIIKMEILLFLDLLKMPSIIGFNKHSKIKLSQYQITLKNLCCEYCLNNMIEELLDLEGIDSAFTNFDFDNCDNYQNIIISIQYNNKVITNKDIKELELKFNS